ncbi:MAG: N-acetylmuramidase [Bacteroidetes bacterium]|nr:MAG: N-acetylmuramidase [Bacteroidota bacterium]
MKRIVLVFTIALLIFSCGSRKKAITKRSETITVNETIEDKDKTDLPKATSPVINSTTQYISVYKDIAMDKMRTYNIPASITLAQGILESGSGRGRLAIKANNHFGIKCHNWKGAKIYHDDDKRQECFRKYSNSDDSFRDHSEFLVKRKRYANLFKLRKDDYKSWAKELRRAGYATDKKYPQKLISIIERYELYKYDKEVLGKRYRKVKNQNVTHKVIKGDTLYSISKKYNITVKRLQHINGLKGTTLQIGQVLQLPKD